MNLRQARKMELSELSALCMRSKAHWGYDDSFVAACRVGLTLGLHDLDENLLRVAEQEGAPVGVAQISLQSGWAELDKLLVEPTHIGCGVGRTLFEWAAQAARGADATSMNIADPAAAPFYRRMGAHDAGTAPSTAIAGRELPHLILTL